VPGKLGDRHISFMSILIDWFPVLTQSLDGRTVLDIGCWSEGTTLLLRAIGADVVGVEEVKKYIDCLNYMKHAFALDRIEGRSTMIHHSAGEMLAYQVHE
jgi:hypothetical protein